MADMDNLSEINENFDTIKTLLNSIRAQGILNTSDVDKLLSGINTKLEKINTEEDIDLIKIFLSELKQNLDERHSVLISKFGAIESLFTNLLKNSSEMPKSNDIKELFDIVATNLSVFSREVISQKETLTDITLRLDALRSDDSQKKDIIKNITLLKPDLERLNNGFDSIVLSLNDNFKTIIKTISTIDKTEYLDKFSDSLNSIEMSSNTVLSALQMLDKKTGQVEDALHNLATKDDITTSNQRLFELTAQSQEMNAAITDFSDRYVRIDNLADKIDATVNIIASLKATMEDAENTHANTIIEQLEQLTTKLETVDSDSKFEDLKNSLTVVLQNIAEGNATLDKSVIVTSQEIQRIANLISSLDINVNFQNLLSAVDKAEAGVRSSIHEVTSKLSTLQDANITRVLNDISSGAETLGAKLNQTQSAISVLCEKNFGSVFENITDLKKLISQIDENSVSANNAIFSSITDRLTIFENSLRTSLDAQEKTVNNSSVQLIEQIDNIKNISSLLDYKMDSSVVEVGNVKREFETLKNSVEEVLALDFVTAVKDLRVDLYASKQEMVNIFETTNSELSEKVTNDLYGKYELLISKLDSVEDEFKKTQTTSLVEIKGTLDKISGSIVDVLSYVSEKTPQDATNIDDKIAEIAGVLKENSLSYIEGIRDVVDVIRIQIENNIKTLMEDNTNGFESVKRSISENSEDIRKELKFSYSKLIEIQDSYSEIKDLLNVTSANSSNKIEQILASAETVKADFDSKLMALKNSLLDKVSDFKQEFTCENADKVSELKFSVENLYNKHSQELTGLIDGIREQFKSLSNEDNNARAASFAKILDNFVAVKDLLKSLNEQSALSLSQKADGIISEISSFKDLINSNNNQSSNDLSEKTKGILDGLSSVKNLVATLNNQTSNDLSEKVESILDELSSVKDLMNSYNNQSSNDLIEKVEGIHDELSSVKDLVNSYNNQSSTNLSKKVEGILGELSSVKDLMNSYNSQASNDLNNKAEGLLDELSSVKDLMNSYNSQASNDLNNKAEGLLDELSSVKDLMNSYNNQSSNNLSEKVECILEDLSSVKNLVSTLNNQSIETLNHKVKDLIDELSSVKEWINTENNQNSINLNKISDNIIEDLSSVKDLLSTISDKSSNNLNQKVADILEALKSIQEQATFLNNQTAGNLSQNTNSILEELSAIKTILDNVDENIDSDMTRQLSIIESNFESLVSQITILFDKSDSSLADKINNEFDSITEKMQEMISEKLESYKLKIEETFDNLQNKAMEQSSYLQERVVDLNKAMTLAFEEQSDINCKQIEAVSSTLKNIIDENIKLTAADYVALKNKLVEFAKNIETNNQNLTQDIKAQLDDITKYVDSVLEIQADEFVSKQTEISTTIKESQDSIEKLAQEQLELAKAVNSDVIDLSKVASKNSTLIESLQTLGREQHEEVITNESEILATAKSIETTSNNTALEIDSVKTNLDSLVQIANVNKGVLDNLETSLSDKTASLKAMVAEISVGELQAMDSYIEKISEQLNAEKEQIELCKNFIVDVAKKDFDIISKNIEKETDVIIGELVEQFELLRKSQADDIVDLTSRMEEIVNAHIYNNIEDLKSYLDIKTDNSVVTSKLDNLKIEMVSSFDDIVNNLNKLLDANVFTSSLSDFRVANEILVNSSIDKLNSQIEAFITENGKHFEDKLALFDKKFVDTIVDKYEEIKLIANQQNASFDSIQKSISDILGDFAEVKDFVNNKLDSLAAIIKLSAESTNKEVQQLSASFENLRSQISNKSFDEAFQASINKQISNLENLVSEQFGYLEDINELCTNNLPDVTELNTLVKNSILESVGRFSEKLEKIDNSVEQVKTSVLEQITDTIESQDITKDLNQMKSDIITQFLNVFNQISFITEQEEILDFIQDKHDELITVLSHIVTTSAEVGAIRDNLSVVDNKIDNLKDDIELLNEKITAIMSSDGDIDYVYSLQELESDIAGLRVALNEIKENNNSQAFTNLLSSTNEIYSLMESIKTEFPTKGDFDGMAEDIVSISSRTNKLILASDESYKTLQDNLQDFKLVINDLDERTRNFAQESGMDRIDSKLNALNSMLINGAKTNQVFNQVFEYLAEWVDNAAVQINAISDRVESLDDIGQIKVMLADLKAEAADNTESVELLEALGTVFDKQAKKIASLETKLDKIIVETTINNKIDMSPMEDTLNRFLVAMDEKMTSQQSKIDSLESKLAGVMSLLDEKDTAQLTKKVGGMDRQIAKLNKSIEKIASHVVEK